MAKKKVSSKQLVRENCCETGKLKLNVLDFAFAGGKICGLIVVLLTISGIYGIMGGFQMWNMLIADMYGALGYSVSWTGVLLGAIYGFIDGFIFFGLMAWIYNKGCLLRNCCMKK